MEYRKPGWIRYTGGVRRPVSVKKCGTAAEAATAPLHAVTSFLLYNPFAAWETRAARMARPRSITDMA
jgi:hypothetical protein